MMSDRFKTAVLKAQLSFLACSRSAAKAVNCVSIDRTQEGGLCAAKGGVPAKTIAGCVTKAFVSVQQEGRGNKEARGIQEMLLTAPI